MNRQRVTPPPTRGPDGLRLPKPPPRKLCGEEVYSRYENNGAGGMRPCVKRAEPDSDFCLYHRKGPA